MQKVEVLQKADSDAASDDSEPPEAVELTLGIDTPVYSTCGSTAAPCSTSAQHDADALPPAPVTIITGFLGAGKTTLVHNILTGDHGLKIAVFMNEFGEEQDLERQMLSKHEGEKLFALEQWVELANGCLCCSLKDDFLKALEALMEQRLRFDYILVETTGLADPGPIASALWVDSELHSSVCLDSIVTVVDAHNLEKQLGESGLAGSANEAERQIAFADTILLNKVDLVDADSLAECSRLIRGINSEAMLLQTEHSSAGVASLLNQGIYSQDTAVANSQMCKWSAPVSSLSQWEADGHASDSGRSASGPASRKKDVLHSSDSASKSAQHIGAAEEHPEEHRHSSRVSTMAIRPSSPLQLSRLREWLEDVLWEGSTGFGEVYRLKGVVQVQGSQKVHIVQAVRELYDIVEGPESTAGDEVQTRLVLIGRDLKRAELLQSFERTLGVGTVSLTDMHQSQRHEADGHAH